MDREMDRRERYIERGRNQRRNTGQEEQKLELHSDACMLDLKGNSMWHQKGRQASN